MQEIKLLDTKYDSFDFNKLQNFEVVENGSDDIYVIQNYPQRYLYSIDKNFDLQKLKYMGYDIIKGDPLKDRVVLIEKNFTLFHTVKPCETLDIIAHKYNTTIGVLMQENHINSQVFIGQILKIK